MLSKSSTKKGHKITNKNMTPVMIENKNKNYNLQLSITDKLIIIELESCITKANRHASTSWYENFFNWII